MKDHVALVIKKDKKFLFIQRSKLKKKLPLAWAFPSGTKENGEALFDTAKREAFEELGVDIVPEEVMCTKELPEFNDKLHFVICSIKSGKPYIKETTEIESLLWLSFKDFFKKFNNSEIGHGLIYLRKNPNLWEKCS